MDTKECLKILKKKIREKKVRKIKLAYYGKILSHLILISGIRLSDVRILSYRSFN